MIITHDSQFLIISKEMLPPAGEKDSCEILQDWGQVLIKEKEYFAISIIHLSA